MEPSRILPASIAYHESIRAMCVRGAILLRSPLSALCSFALAQAPSPSHRQSLPYFFNNTENMPTMHLYSSSPPPLPRVHSNGAENTHPQLLCCNSAPVGDISPLTSTGKGKTYTKIRRKGLYVANPCPDTWQNPMHKRSKLLHKST